ncbi:hypothetical protein DFQ28_007597 [Apophysomyces sp. BC1034]|nr:hypothetical protein DFQ28_007597 [Apophysomyces sp. BC1034]
MILKLALQMAREDYEDRRECTRQGIELARQAGKYKGHAPKTAAHARIVALHRAGYSITKTAELAGCSVSQVKRVWAMREGTPNEKAGSHYCGQRKTLTNIG